MKRPNMSKLNDHVTVQLQYVSLKITKFCVQVVMADEDSSRSDDPIIVFDSRSHALSQTQTPQPSQQLQQLFPQQCIQQQQPVQRVQPQQLFTPRPGLQTLPPQQSLQPGQPIRPQPQQPSTSNQRLTALQSLLALQKSLHSRQPLQPRPPQQQVLPHSVSQPQFRSQQYNPDPRNNPAIPSTSARSYSIDSLLANNPDSPDISDIDTYVSEDDIHDLDDVNYPWVLETTNHSQSHQPTQSFQQAQDPLEPPQPQLHNSNSNPDGSGILSRPGSQQIPQQHQQPRQPQQVQQAPEVWPKKINITHALVLC